jgi:5,10-methylenetetrahydrofolate reductase
MGPTDDMSLPTISRFFQERSGGADAAVTQVKYDEEALERMRQKLLAKKD